MLNFINWLLYDKPLFNKVGKRNYSCSINRENWKKNWLSLVKVYDSYESNYNWCFIRVTSHLSEDDYIVDKRNTLTIGFGGRYIKWLLPFSIIKPVVDYHTYIKDSNDVEVEPKQIKYTIYVEKEYSIKIVRSEGYLTIDWGTISNTLYNINKYKGKEFWWWFFWRNSYMVKKELLNLDHTVFKDITELNDLGDYDEIEKIVKYQPFTEFNILDYDKEPIIAIARLTRTTHKYGNGKFTRLLMTLLNKVDSYTRIDIEYNKEVGPKKGSWKGGTLGVSFTINDNDSIIDIFKKYCLNQDRGNSIKYNLTYLGYKIYKDYGITDSVLVESDKCNPMKTVLVNLDKNYVMKYDLCDYDIPINFSIISNDFCKVVNTTNKYYKINFDRSIDLFLFNAYLYKTNNPEVTSNCLEYIFTNEAMEYILKSGLEYPFKHIEFVDVCK